MPILSIHPKYMPDALIVEEHNAVHGLFDALSGAGPMPEQDPDLFRFKGRRGRLYMRHRMLVEEMILRGMPHLTLLDRRPLEAEEWLPVEAAEGEALAEAAALGGSAKGRVGLPEGVDVDVLTGKDEICTAFDAPVDREILFGLWLRYRHLVMERSYERYRELADPLRGRSQASVWMLFDLVLEEAFSHDPDPRAPAIAYETVWEELEPNATPAERNQYGKLTAALVPGQVSLPMRRFLAAAAARQGESELLKARMLNAYL